jgi:uncharacterized RDD family membrane protein YckC
MNSRKENVKKALLDSNVDLLRARDLDPTNTSVTENITAMREIAGKIGLSLPTSLPRPAAPKPAQPKPAAPKPAPPKPTPAAQPKPTPSTPPKPAQPPPTSRPTTTAKPKTAPAAPTYVFGDVASLGAHIGAFLVDVILVAVLDVVVVYFGIFSGQLSADQFISFYLAIFGMRVAYYTLLHGVMKRTIGEMITRTQVVDTDDRPIGFFRALWRALVFALMIDLLGGFQPLISFLVLLVPVVNNERRGLHDFLSGTRLIKP